MIEMRVRTWPKIVYTNEPFFNLTDIHDTDINLMPKKYAGAVGLDRCPMQVLLYKKKTSGTDNRRTLDVLYISPVDVLALY